VPFLFSFFLLQLQQPHLGFTVKRETWLVSLLFINTNY